MRPVTTMNGTPGGAHALDGRAAARVQHGVLADQRPVEVAGEGVDPPREPGREPQLCVDVNDERRHVLRSARR